MELVATAISHKAVFLNTAAFIIFFAVWMLNGGLVTFLASNQVCDWGPVEIGWLMGIPVLTGSIFRLPAVSLPFIHPRLPCGSMHDGVRRNIVVRLLFRALGLEQIARRERPSLKTGAS